ncbi:MAG: GAF domain-containing protein, partial [Nitrospinota bacterium]
LWTSNRLETKKEDLQGLEIAIMPWWMNQLKNDKSVAVSSVANLPKEAGVEKGIIQNQGIGALVDVPMSFAGNIVGFLGLSMATENRNWSEEEIGLLRLTGQLFTNALQRKQTEEDMKRNIEDLEQFSRLSVGREKKMISLKKEINDLKTKLGEEEKYSIIE